MPSLVFINLDGGSVSIITNNEKNEKEYKDLLEFWNSENFDYREIIPLINYKEYFQSEFFIDKIKILFSLDSLGFEEIKKILGDYILTFDNFIKIIRILLNIEAKLPTILMGETGVGKTKILEIISLLYFKGKNKMKKIEIYSNTSSQDIIDFINKIKEEVKYSGEEGKLTSILFDGLNNCNSLDLIEEIICHHTYLGEKLSKNFIFFGTRLPYRILDNKLKEIALYNRNEKNRASNLVYKVNPFRR